MVFSSVAFLFYFLPIVIGLYFLINKKFKNVVLLIASLFFYAWGEPVYVCLMIASIVINYVFGFLINAKRNRLVLGLGISINILILGFFKYANFLIDTINNIFSLQLLNLDLALPIGISFYTFQAVSYLIDLYRRDVTIQKNFIDFATYISLFPQLIAGPIVRLKSIEENLHCREHSWELFGCGAKRFTIGLAKKVIIANNVGMIWDRISESQLTQLSVATAWIGAVAFTIQIYFDFSGYSDMAIGLGKMFGFEFPENFKYPYMSRSISEFWRRWHITLGSWFREYVYIPLGGNRKGIIVQLFNIIIVWMLTGLWHGASWNFVLWGLYFAVFLVLEKVFLLKTLKKLPGFFSRIYTIFLLILSWVIFSLEDIGDIVLYYKALFGFGSGGLIDGTSSYIFFSSIVILIISIVGATDYPAKIGRKFLGLFKQDGIMFTLIESIWMVFLMVISIAFIIASTYNPFLYFRF